MLAPKDHWPLVKELKKLSLQEAIRLLRYCQSLYKMHGVAANVQLLKPHKGSRTPYLRCVVEWITALLDAHFAALVLAPECHALLKVSLSLALSLYLSLSRARASYLSLVSLSLARSHTLPLLSPSLAICSRVRALSLSSLLSLLSLSLALTQSLFSLALSLSLRSLFALSCSLLLSLALSLSLSHSLTLCPLAHTHTQDLKDITKAETALAKETLSLNGLLLHLLHKKPLPVKPMRYYSVENLYFPA